MAIRGPAGTLVTGSRFPGPRPVATLVHTGAYTMFSANHFDFVTKKIPRTEENLLYKMAQPLFRASRADFEFNLIHCFSGVFQANFTLKSRFWPL